MEKMTIEEVMENMRKIEGEEDIYTAIVEAFGNYEYEEEDEVIVSSPSEMNSFNPNTYDVHAAYINHADAPIVYFKLEHGDEEDTYTVVDVW